MKKDGLIDVIKSKHLGEGTHYGRPVMVYPEDLASAVRLWISQNLPDRKDESEIMSDYYRRGFNQCLKEVKSKLLEERYEIQKEASSDRGTSI